MASVLRPLNQLLDRMTRREFFLLLLFLGTAVFIWGVSLLNRVGETRESYQANQRTFETQEVWLDNAEAIRTRMEREIGLLERSQTLNSTRLVAELNALARRQNLSPSIDSPRTDQGDAFQFHTVVVRLSRAPLDRIMSFTDEVQARAPYLALNSLVLSPDRTNPNNLEARFEITAVEVVGPN